MKILFNRVLSFLPYIFVFIFSIYPPSDPDLGWHLKYGEYFWQHGSLLRDNTFSTMMPDFHWANTSWLTDIISYTTFHGGGLFGLTLLGAAVVSLTFYFFAKASRMTLWEQTIVFPLILYLEDPVNAISFRGQQVVLLCIGILFYLLSLYEKKPKLLWLTIPLFWIWVDIDGEFLLGYALFVSWVLLYIVRKLLVLMFTDSDKKSPWWHTVLKNYKEAFKRESKEIGTLCLLLLCCLAATFINPFGYGLHLDAISHIGNPLLKDIGEYLPFQMYSQGWWNEVLVGIILIFGLFILSFQGKFGKNIPILGGGLFLYFLSLAVLRYAWPAYYTLFPLLAMTATFLKPDGKQTTKYIACILLVIFIAIGIKTRSPITNYVRFSWLGYCQIQVLPCTKESAQYLISHHLTQNLFSLYGWGGWLIWNYPQIKPTIDGRMHLWVQNGYSAFADYYSIEQNFSDIDKTKYDIVYMSPDKPVFNRLLFLVKEGKWDEVYQDKYAGIFVRKKS